MEIVAVTVRKNREVKNGWNVEKGNVGEDCKDRFVNKQGGKIGRSKLAEVEEGNLCNCINKKSGEK